MNRFVRSLVSAGAAAFVATQSAFAQVQPSIVVAFDLAGPVPVGSWGITAAEVLMVASAAVLLRKRNRAASRLLGAVAAAGVVGAVATAPQSSQAFVPIPTTNMVTSPATAMVNTTGPYPFVNLTGNTIVIRSITLVNPGSFSLQPLTTTCVAGNAVSANATCYIGIQNMSQ